MPIVESFFEECKERLIRKDPKTQWLRSKERDLTAVINLRIDHFRGVGVRETLSFWLIKNQRRIMIAYLMTKGMVDREYGPLGHYSLSEDRLQQDYDLGRVNSDLVVSSVHDMNQKLIAKLDGTLGWVDIKAEPERVETAIETWKKIA
jgi:hypothetical protein